MTTKIRWTDDTWNPVTGCSHVSPGCEHCYAERFSLRIGRSEKPWAAQFAAENVQVHPERLTIPLRWRRPRRIFTCSMSDLFHELVPFEFVDQVFAAMAWAEHHTFQVLTKRPERMREYIRHIQARDETEIAPLGNAMCGLCGQLNGRLCGFGNDDCQLECHGWPLPNVWLGTSVEDQRRANERIPVLLDTPAAVHFLSCEPLLGPVDLRPWLFEVCPKCNGTMSVEPWGGYPGGQACPWCLDSTQGQGYKQTELDWVIVGGESGPGYRFADGYERAARSLRDQCTFARVAFFHKQSPGPRTEMGQELDGVRWEQFPRTDEEALAI